jgi:hypothetical protein
MNALVQCRQWRAMLAGLTCFSLAGSWQALSPVCQARIAAGSAETIYKEG